MKKILITGANSYIGTSAEKWLQQYPNDYQVDTLDMIDDSWNEYNFSSYDTIIHVSAIVHLKEKKSMEELYYKVNRDLAVDVAKKAMSNKVKQFIFMSSMSVYGLEKGVINENTQTNPKTYYGKSKLAAEEEIKKLSSNNYNIAIVRPPLIFGNNCKGNFQKLSKLAQKKPIFPRFKNRRSMIYIDNLCEFIRLLIDSQEGGIYFPQNEDYFSSSEIVKILSKEYNHKILFTKLGNCLVYLIRPISNSVNKLFGNLVYDKSLSACFDNKYNIMDNDKSIKGFLGK